MRLLVIAAALALSAGSGMAQNQGDWVLGRFQGGQYWFPGVVRAVSAGTVTVAYDDGDQEVLPRNLVRPYNWAVGTAVHCNFQNAGTWYPGRITALSGNRISILYEDGDRENTTTGRCRSE
jgi:hypothetical protein